MFASEGGKRESLSGPEGSLSFLGNYSRNLPSYLNFPLRKSHLWISFITSLVSSVVIFYLVVKPLSLSAPLHIQGVTVKMSLQYIKDDKGKDQLLYKGYLYKKVRSNGNKTFWKCAEYHKYCCTGRAHTSHDQVIKSLPHLHPPTRMPTEADQVPCGMKKISMGPETIPKTNTASCNALSEVRTKKWCTNHPSQTIQRLRACLKATRQPSPNLREPITAVETTVKEPIIPSALTSPGCHEFTDSAMDRTYMPNPALCKEKHAPNTPSIQANREAGRQRFRLSTLLPGETLQEILSRLSTTAVQWLCPQEHSKDQIVDMVILEQFLSVLPGDMQTWMKAQEPGSSKEALHLAMAYNKQEPAKPIQDIITFEDVSIHFTEEEWTLLDHKEKNLYWKVMHQNYDNVACLASDQIKGESQEEDPLQKVFEPAVEWLEKSKETVLQHPEQKLNNNCPKNQQKRTLEKEEIFTGSERNMMGPDRDIILLGTELSLQSQYIHVDYGEGGASAIPIHDQKSLKGDNFTEEDHVVCMDDLQDESYQPSLDSCKKQAQPGVEDMSQIGPKKIRKAAKREILLCDYDGCGKIFSNRQYLNYHKKYQHVHQKTFPCSDPSCRKSFNFKKHLKEHEKLHSDKRDYICEFCARSFRRSSTLIVHRRIHTGEKPLQCKICGFTCRQKASLNWHMKKHDADSFYQFSCDLCGKKFEKKDNVTAHKSKGHPEGATGPPPPAQEPPPPSSPLATEPKQTRFRISRVTWGKSWSLLPLQLPSSLNSGLSRRRKSHSRENS